MAGEEGHGMVDVAMRHRNAGIGEPTNTGGDAGHDAEGDIVFDQRQRLLTAAPEHEGITALQPQHPLAGARKLHQPQRNVALFRRRLAAALAGIFHQRFRPRQRQAFLIDQRIVHDNVGLEKPLGGE